MNSYSIPYLSVLVIFFNTPLNKQNYIKNGYKKIIYSKVFKNITSYYVCACVRVCIRVMKHWTKTSIVK